MKRDLSLQRCRNHAEREAVARCPGCGHHFCRECVTEHDDRILCAACLRKLTACELPNLWKPRADQFFVVNSFPMLGTGKLDLKGVKEQAAQLSVTTENTPA